MTDNDNSTEILFYTGVGEGASCSKRDVVHVRIDPSVVIIPEIYFRFDKRQVEEVELHDGVREISDCAFRSFYALKALHLSDGVESIGGYAFKCCMFTKFRCPPLITTISDGMFHSCQRLFSLELPEDIIQVERYACWFCFSLRNIALASNTNVGMMAFSDCLDLLQIFDTEEAIANALKRRFDGLPIHCWIYYISYHHTMTTEEFLHSIVIGENEELNPTGLQQDCLGMTPLHILACSTVHQLEVYQYIVEKYPENLIGRDAWGATPLLYAVWGDSPSEIVKFLINSYQSLYPDHCFNWNNMLFTLGRANVSKGVILNLLAIQQTLCPRYNINWDWVLRKLAELQHGPSKVRYNLLASPQTYCFLTRCSIATRVSAICVKHFRDAMAQDAMADEWAGNEYFMVGGYEFDGEEWHTETLRMLAYYESESQRLKESTSLLELAMWKMKLDAGIDQGEAIGGGNMKTKMDTSDVRLQCRISCGADQVVANVLSYLISPDFVRYQRPLRRR
jgi:hypothetical protein